MGREQDRDREGRRRPCSRLGCAGRRQEGAGAAARSEAARPGGSAGERAAIRDLGPDTAAVATVAGCNDQDRVARQLCEAATKEQDPFLRAALWDEYNEYKKLVARD